MSRNSDVENLNCSKARKSGQRDESDEDEDEDDDVYSSKMNPSKRVKCDNVDDGVSDSLDRKKKSAVEDIDIDHNNDPTSKENGKKLNEESDENSLEVEAEGSAESSLNRSKTNSNKKEQSSGELSESGSESEEAEQQETETTATTTTKNTNEESHGSTRKQFKSNKSKENLAISTNN